jgi:tight adherence protein B
MSVLLAGAGAAVAAGTLVGARAPRRRLQLGPPPRWARLAAAAAAGVTVATAWRLADCSPVQLLAVGLSAVVLRRVLRARALRRRRDGLEEDVVVMCFAAAAELRAGRAPAEALGTAATQLDGLSCGLKSAATAVGRGARGDDELLALAREVGSPRLETVSAVWAATADTGAGVAAVLDRVAQAFAAEDQARSELGALAAGPRATALVLCALPAFALALGAAIGADPTGILLGSPFGWLLTALAAGLDGCGLLWVRRITSTALAG